MKKEFTIGFVNYKTSLYMDTQLKIYKNYAGENFEIIILDNTKNKNELNNLKRILEKNEVSCTLIENDPKEKAGSAQHGAGLQKIYNLVETDFFITQDPDFFWVMPNFLTFLKEKLKDNILVGAPYTDPKISNWNGPSDFPAAFGCAYHMKDLRRINADFTYTDPKKELAPYNIIKDVGHKIRSKLRNESYFSFEYKFFNNDFGEASFGLNNGCHSYLYKGTVFAYHILRGSFTISNHIKISNEDRLKHQIPSNWYESRIKYCDYFWRTINNAAKK